MALNLLRLLLVASINFAIIDPILSSKCLESYPKPRDKEKNKTTIEIGYITSTYWLSGDQRIPMFPPAGAVVYGISRPTHRKRASSNKYRFAMRLCEAESAKEKSVKLMAHLCEEGKVRLIISDRSECRTEGMIAAAYNIPMISVSCDDPELSDKTKFPTFTRLRPQPGDIANIIVALLRHFNWTKVALVTPSADKYQLLKNDVIRSFKKHNIDILIHTQFNRPYDHPNTTANYTKGYFAGMDKTFQSIVRDTYKKTRIYVILGLHTETLGLVHALDQQKLLQSGKYFVVGADKHLHEEDTRWVGKWNSKGFYFSKDALKAYLQISLRPSQKSTIYHMVRLSSYKLLSNPPFNIKIDLLQKSQPLPSFFMSYLLDAVNLYIDTIDKLTQEPGFNQSQLSDGKKISKRMRGISYRSLLGYMVRTDDRGEAEGNYTVYRTIGRPVPDKSERLEVSGKMKNIGTFYMSVNITGLPTFQEYKKVTMKWIGNARPLDEPPCGFTGDRCKTRKDITYQVALSVMGGVFLIFIIIGSFVYRNHRFEQELDMLLWKIDYKDLAILTSPDLTPGLNGMVGQQYEQVVSNTTSSGMDIYYGNNNGNKTMSGEVEEHEALLHSKSGSTVTTRSVGSLILMAGYADLEFGKMYAPVATYKKQIVAVKRIYKLGVNVNRTIKKELKLLRDITNQTNQNLTKFLGACVDEGKICAVWEYCERGSLPDILYNDQLSLEPMFITSLVNDLLSGLTFLHDSDLRCHGNLKSSNCVVDSRWTLKLTDFGLAEFKHGESVDHLNEAVYFYGLFWSAPELLRYMVCRRPYSALSQHMTVMAQALKDSVFDREVFHAAAPDWTAMMKADIYALGIILYEIHSRKRPFYSHNENPFEIVRRVIVLNDEFHVPYRPNLSELSTVDKHITDFIEACWSEHPSARPTVKQARNRLKDMVGNKGRNIFDNMMNLMETYAKNLERLVNERTGQLIEEKRRTEELLYQMLPMPVAEQLKRNKRVEAEAFDSVTIYFSDIVGFTELSAESTPFEVVQLLNDLYTTCDSIIANFEVYKVETIGDAYMVVSGVPRRINNHAGEIADMSMNMLEVITSSFKIRHRPNETLKLRIGINSGPCCAGVVGTRMPRFCLFGDTVNMASRMESSGEPCKIHVSEQCKQELDQIGNYITVDRGEIQIKGRGSIHTYWLYGKRSETGEVVTPFNDNTLPFVGPIQTTSTGDVTTVPPSMAISSNTPKSASKGHSSKGKILPRPFIASLKSYRNSQKNNASSESNQNKVKDPLSHSSSFQTSRPAATIVINKESSAPITEIIPQHGTLNLDSRKNRCYINDGTDPLTSNPISLI